jgi:hypothetical protein
MNRQDLAYKKPEVHTIELRVLLKDSWMIYKLIFCLKSSIFTMYNPFARSG